VKSLIALFAGMLVATVGVDDIYGAVRYDFGTDVRATASTTSRS
jgi:TctA family transporter